MDIVKLAIFTQCTININNKKEFSFNIEGFKVNFFVTSLESESVYVMKKMEDVVLPRCLNDLLSFVNMKTINEILQITKYFWEACNEDLDASQLRNMADELMPYVRLHLNLTELLGDFELHGRTSKGAPYSITRSDD